jgi:LysM repeat protein
MHLLKKIFSGSRSAPALFAVAVAVVLLVPATATAQNVTPRVAALEQEVAELRNQNQQLREEMQDLRRLVANATQPHSSGSSAASASQAQIKELARSTDAQLRALEARANRYTDAQVLRLAKDVNTAIAKADAPPPKPVRPPKSHTTADAAIGADKPPSSDMPKNGIEYVIKQNDTIEKIARNNHSRTAWILAANKLTERQAKRLKIGNKIFVPQKSAAATPPATPPPPATAETAAAE